MLVLEDLLKHIEKRVKELLPSEAEVVKVEAEGPEIVVYTKNIKLFFEDESLIKKLASELKKRFIVRSDQSSLTDPETTRSLIESIVPKEAEISRIDFDPEFGEVIIEAKKLGLVIGSGGKILKEIVTKTGWVPKVLRTPTKPSEIIKGIRGTLIEESKERKRILKNIGRNIYRIQTRKTEWVRVIFLGGSREVGRSCFLVETPESKVMLDCGVNIANIHGAYPYLDSLSYSLDEIDAVIISHAHLDHSGALPFLFNYGYEGPVYCTPPTRDTMILLQKDFVDISKKTGEELIYGEKHIRKMLKHTITRNYGEVTDITPDIRLTLHNAGHIIGSSIVHLHIGDGLHNLVYTGDMKFGPSRLFDPAEVHFPRVETLIIESTYGGPKDVHPPRQVAESELYKTVKSTVENGGTVLIPVFAVGRAQEVMLAFEMFAKKDPDWNHIVYLDGMTREASAIHTVYPEYLRKSLQKRILHNDSPFDSEIFQLVDPTKRKDIAEEGGNIIMSPAGMLTGGPAIEYFKFLCEDEKNTIIFVGYQAEGTLGKKVQKGIKEVALEENGKLRGFQVKMNVKTIEGFSGHSDITQLLSYVKKLSQKPHKIIAVHGEEKKCVSLARMISSKYRVETRVPHNLEAVRIV